MIDFLDESPIKNPIIFDTHSHYDDEKFDDIRDELLSSLKSNGVGGIVTCGCDYKSSLKAIELSEKYDYIYSAVGIHPENLDDNSNISDIEKLLNHNKCVALGEIGLDYYWNSENKEFQKQIFEAQIILANKYDKPIIVHDREAHSDTLEILKKYKPKGVVHCFSGSPEMAKEILKLGMYIGVGGTVTFKNARRLPEVVEMLPKDKILLETDCPYLAPVPFRSKTNHSAMIYFTAKRVAEIRNTSIDEILVQSFNNAKNLFGIK